MAFDFPSSPTVNQIFIGSNGAQYIWNGVTWNQVSGNPATLTAQARNRIINPAMQISQENSNTAGTTAGGYCAADQWMTVHLSSATVTSQRVQVVTPNGSVNRYRATITAADVAIAAGDYCVIVQTIEGTCIADFRWGTAAVKQVVLRFGFKGPAGTYSISVRNAPIVRSYLANFTIDAGQANTDTVQTFVIPGDTAGTWLIDTSQGGSISIVLAAGSTFQGAAGWSAGNFFGTTSNTNGIGTAGAVFELFDVGLYLDDQNTGVPPAFEVPDYAQELAACQRYWQWVAFQFWGNVTSGQAYIALGKLYQMRASPAMGGAINVSNTSFPATPGTYTIFNFLGGGVSENRTANVTGGGGWQSVAAANARM